MIAERHRLSFSSNTNFNETRCLGSERLIQADWETHSVKKFQIELLLRLLLSASGYFFEIAHS